MTPIEGESEETNYHVEHVIDCSNTLTKVRDPELV